MAHGGKVWPLARRPRPPARRGILLRVTLLSILVVFGACRTSAPAEAPENAPIPMLVEVGHEEFLRNCASCHGIGGRGDGPVAAALRTQPSDLTRIAARRGGEFPADEIAAWIDGRLAPLAHGTREMPIWGVKLAEGMPPGELTQDLVRGRIVTLVEYLRSIQVK